MIKRLLALLLLAASPALADIAVIFDEAHVNERVLSMLPSIHAPDYIGRTDVVLYSHASDMPTLTEPMLYWRHDTDVIRDMTGPEKAALDVELAAAATQRIRDYGTEEIDATTGRGVRTRAIAELLVRENNLLRQWIMGFKAEVAAASNLNGLKTGVASLPNMPDRTLSQAKTAYINLINAGDVD